jgi:hypothetical protein
MYKRHENELLGVLINAHTLQEQYIDFWTAGHWHQALFDLAYIPRDLQHTP